MSFFWKGGEKRNFNVLIYEEDYKELCLWVLKKPNIETGGDLFGLWADKHTAVIQMVLGPGKSCTRTTVSFYQDIDYLRRVGSYLTENEGVCHIGEWHSHHQLGLARPSGGDENTVWNNMPTYNLKRFVIFIANIQSAKQSYNVNVGCFLFEIDDQGKHMDVLPGTFTILQKNSPLSWKIEVSQERKKGAEKDDESKIAIKELKMEVKEREKRPSVTYLKPKPTTTASERKRVSRGQNNSQLPANPNKPDNEESSVDNKKRKMNTEESSPDKTSGHGKTVLEGSLPCEDLKNLAINNEPKEEETSEEAMEQGKEMEQPEKNSPEELKHESEEQHDGERGKSVGKKENDEAGSPQTDQGKTENAGESRSPPNPDDEGPEAKLTQKPKYEGEDENKVTTNDEQPEVNSEEVMKKQEQEERERHEKKNQEEVRRDEQRDKGKGKIQGHKGEILGKDKEAGSSQVEKEKVEKNSNPRPLPPKPGKEALPGSKTQKKKEQDKGTTHTRAAQSGAKNAGSSQTRPTKGPKKQK